MSRSPRTRVRRRVRRRRSPRSPSPRAATTTTPTTRPPRRAATGRRRRRRPTTPRRRRPTGTTSTAPAAPSSRRARPRRRRRRGRHRGRLHRGGRRASARARRRRDQRLRRRGDRRATHLRRRSRTPGVTRRGASSADGPDSAWHRDRRGPGRRRGRPTSPTAATSSRWCSTDDDAEQACAEDNLDQRPDGRACSFTLFGVEPPDELQAAIDAVEACIDAPATPRRRTP